MPTLSELQANGPVLYPTTFVDTNGRVAGILRPDGTIIPKGSSTTGSTIRLDATTVADVKWNGETNLLGDGHYVDSIHMVARLAREAELVPDDVETEEPPTNEPETHL